MRVGRCVFDMVAGGEDYLPLPITKLHVNPSIASIIEATVYETTHNFTSGGFLRGGNTPLSITGNGVMRK